MSSPETNQAAHVAFSATVASALARSIRDTPLHPQAAAAHDAPPESEAHAIAADTASTDDKEAA